MDTLAPSAIKRSLISGTIAGIGVMATAAAAGKRETGSWAAPLNATSHILWGDDAAYVDDVTAKHTLPGIALSHASAIFWAVFYEQFFGKKQHTAGPPSLWQPLIGSAAVTAAAYITDYYLVPKRFTPGYEKRVSGKSLALIYGALALGLAARDFISASRVQRPIA